VVESSVLAILFVLVVCGGHPYPASAAGKSDGDETSGSSATELAAAKLADEFSDPLTTLPQLFLLDASTPTTYGIRGYTNRATARVIVPRLPRFSLFPFVQLIRPSISLVTLPDAKGGPQTAFGDMQFFDLAVLPWPERESGLLLGIGPVFVFPTAS